MPLYTQLNASEPTKVSYCSEKLEILWPVNLIEPEEPVERFMPSPLSFIKPVDCLVFPHIPKTGGTNVDLIVLALHKSNSSVKQIRVRMRNKKAGISPNLITEGWTGGLKSAEADLKIDPHAYDQYNFINSHFPFGLHEFLKRPVKYIVLIRDPIARAISSTNFDYQRRHKRFPEKDKLAHAIDYLLSAEIDNPQTRLLAGQAFMSGPCNDKTLEMAKSNIKNHFLLAGVTEDTNSFIQILASIQNWGPLALSRNQVTGDKIITQLDTETLEKLVNKHQYDLRLYNWVKEQWQLWKKTYIGTVQDISARKITCITSDFALTGEPILMTEQEVARYNEGVTEKLIKTNPAVLTKGNRLSNFLPGFFELKNRSGDPMELSEERHFPRYL